MSAPTLPTASPGIDLQTTNATSKQDLPVKNVDPTITNAPVNNPGTLSSNSANTNTRVNTHRSHVLRFYRQKESGNLYEKH